MATVTRRPTLAIAVLAVLPLFPFSAMAHGRLEGTVRVAATGDALPGAQVSVTALSLGGIRSGKSPSPTGRPRT